METTANSIFPAIKRRKSTGRCARLGAAHEGFAMNTDPIHQNLSTSFVNIAALVRHLRELQFVGSVHIDFSSYEADIILNGSRPVRAREYDHIAGRISQGEHAFKRILVRAKEPHGRIHVYPEGHPEAAAPVFVDKRIAAGARAMAAARGEFPGNHVLKIKPLVAANEAPDEFEMLLDLTGTLLRTIDDSLAKAELNFTGAFRNACADLTEDYPFLDPSLPNFIYKHGEIKVTGYVDPMFFSAGIMAALRIVMTRLSGRPNFSKVYHFTTQRIRCIARDHKRLCDRFGLSGELERLANMG